MSNSNTKKCGFVAIIGAPNAGKSTLLNNIIGSKVSIVTPKVQTTRTQIRGISIEDNTQLVFIDTPGIFKPKKQLDKSMVKAAWGGLKNADFSLLLVDARKGLCEETEGIIKGLAQRDMDNNILIINKIDLVKREKLLDLTTQLNELCKFDKTFMISALKNNGVEDLKNFLRDESPENQWMYPEDQITDIHMRMFAAEITREKLMLRFDQELPYKLMVDTEKWEEKKGGKIINIHQIIYVTSENHKKIIVGKNGQGIKEVGEKSRKELSYLLEAKVNLYLFVKVKQNWLTNREHYEMMGLDF